MSGRHRKHAHLSLKITGGLVAGAALASTFAMSAHADTPAQPALAAKAAALPQMPVPETGSMTTAGKPAGTVVKPGAKAAAPAAQKAAEVTAAQMIAKAKSQLGQKEDGKGETKFAHWYSKTSRAAETIARDGGDRKGYLKASWCDMFVSWTASEVGAQSIVGQDAWTVAHAKWFKANGKWGTTPKAGAIVFFDWGGSKSLDAIEHVGIVTGTSNGKINTIEGNTGNRVQLKTRSAGQIVGYGYPDYKAS
ncbi:CHAP domain-containing protein [Actinocorallia longicatena]|uniref:Peptidase C51 domain-containing protein n=1 Tax=Actinocorallia longicatena TaxID=111803 RepID=A0ABP6QDH3_9ACTN